jgi:hypothetical protein
LGALKARGIVTSADGALKIALRRSSPPLHAATALARHVIQRR